MTAASFEALAQLLRLRQGPQREAARLVLVDGVRQADAARMAGCVVVLVGPVGGGPVGRGHWLHSFPSCGHTFRAGQSSQ